MLAETQWKTGLRDESLATLDRLVERSPRIDHQLLLAQCLVEDGRHDEARGMVGNALREYAHAPRHVRRTFARAAARMRKLQRELDSQAA
jgi:hypothetical protein